MGVVTGLLTISDVCFAVTPGSSDFSQGGDTGTGQQAATCHNGKGSSREAAQQIPGEEVIGAQRGFVHKRVPCPPFVPSRCEYRGNLLKISPREGRKEKCFEK